MIEYLSLIFIAALITSDLVSAYDAIWHTPVAVPFKGLTRLVQRPATRPDPLARTKYLAAWYGQQDLAAA